MNRLSRAFSVFRKGVDPAVSDSQWLTLGAQSSSGTSKRELIRKYSSWVYSCVNIRAKAIAGVTWRVYVKGGADELVEIEDHPLVLLLDNPNAFYTRSELLMLLSQHQDLTGDAYWYTPTNGFGAPGEIWPLPPERMKIKTDKTSFLLGYELQNGTETIQFKPEEVIHFRFPHPSDPYYGASPLAAAILSVDIDESQHKFQSNFYKNSGIPPLALETDGDVLPALRTKMREEWSENYSGSKNSGKIPILSNGLKVKPIGISPSQFNWLEANKSTRDDILSIYGVPASKLGLVEDVNRANADANDYTFSANVIEPILNLLDERMTKDLAIKFDPRLIVKHDSTIRDDDKAEADVAKVRLSAGMTTINEERLAEGYEPVEGGDEILVPRNMVTLRDVIAGKVNNSQSTQTMTPAEDMTNP